MFIKDLIVNWKCPLNNDYSPEMTLIGTK